MVDGHELLAAVTVPGGHPPTLHGCFPMAPFAGRLHEGRLAWRGRVHELPRHAPPHAMHGTAVDAAWVLDEATSDAAVLTHELAPPWPFAGRVVQRVRLHEDGVEATLELTADEEMPVVLGWHPWFRRDLGAGGPVQVHVDPVQQYERGDDGLPTGRLVPPRPGPHDDCFLGLRAPARLVWPELLEVTVASDVEHWVLFDEHPAAVCVEPQTGPPDAVRLGRATVVQPGGSLALPLRLRWRRPSADRT